jgi:hypothetical protein
MSSNTSHAQPSRGGRQFCKPILEKTLELKIQQHLNAENQQPRLIECQFDS